MSLFACADNEAFPHSHSYAGRGGYPFPFLDPVSQVNPKSWREVYHWGRLVLTKSPEFVDAHRKLWSYFITALEFKANTADDQEMTNEEMREWEQILVNKLMYKEKQLEMGLSVSAFGSSIFTVQTSCKRLLVCPHPECGAVTDFVKGARDNSIDFQFDFGSGRFLFRCPAPNCPNKKRRVAAIVKDWHDKSPESLTIKSWPPDEMLIDYYLWTDTDDIYWRIPEYYKQAVRRGNIETLAQVDLDVLDAIRTNRLFRFHRDRVFHAKENTIAGLGLRGRGVPRSLLMAPQIWMMQVLRHQNQALCMDYLIPLGFFSLDDSPRATEFSGPASSVNPNNFANDINQMVTEHRRDPTKRYALPYAVRYQIAGGEASQLAPVALLQEAKTDVYDAAGVPLEMYRGSLNIQVMPVAARLFEASHQTIPSLYNRFASFAARRVAEELDRPEIQATHVPSTVVSDIQRMGILMQGNQMQQVSRGTLYTPIGIDPAVERDRIMEEMLEDARSQKELQDKLEQEQLVDMMNQVPPPPQDPAAAQGAPPQGSTPLPASMPPSQGVMTDSMGVEDMAAEAERLASQLVNPQIPQAQVNQELAMIRSQSPELHTLVRGAMDRLRQQAASQGQQAILSGQM